MESNRVPTDVVVAVATKCSIPVISGYPTWKKRRRRRKNVWQYTFSVYSSSWVLVGIRERPFLRRHRSCSVSSRFSSEFQAWMKII